eukprot:6097742-Ditylum_brightwellii.AAC.1
MHDLQQKQAQRVGTKQEDRINTFQEHTTKGIEKEKIGSRTIELEEKYNKTGEVVIAELEEIDDALHNSAMDAASLLPPVPRAWWHLEIENAFRLQQHWKAELSFQQNK